MSAMTLTHFSVPLSASKTKGPDAPVGMTAEYVPSAATVAGVPGQAPRSGTLRAGCQTQPVGI